MTARVSIASTSGSAQEFGSHPSGSVSPGFAHFAASLPEGKRSVVLDRASTLPDNRNTHRALLPALLMVTLLTAMDQTIVATALPSVVSDIGGQAAMGWVFAGYTLAMTVVMPVFGRAGDLRGRRTFFLASIAGFVAASAACGFAGSMGMLIVLRVVQGIAGGGVLVMSQAVVADAVPARERGRFMAPVGMVFAFSSVVSPLLGGTLTDTVGWRSIFWVNLPLGILALLLAHHAVPRRQSPHGSGRFDVLGAVLYAVAVVGLVLLSAAGSSFRILSLAGLALAVIAAAAGALFVVRMLTHSDPLIPVGVLRNRTVAIASCLGFVLGAAVFGVVGYLPTVVQSVLGLRATMSGAVLLALVLGMMVTTTASGRWLSRTGRYRRLPLVGCALAAAAVGCLSGLDSSWTVLEAAAVIAVLGLGAGLFMQVITIAAQDAVEHDHVGSATSTVSLVRELGVTVGAAGIGAALAASGSAEGLAADVRTGVPGVFIALALVLLAGAVASLLLPDSHLSSSTQS